MKRSAKLLFIVLFFVLCIVPVLFAGFVTSNVSENRILSKFPSWTLQDGTFNRNYFEELQTYVSEHFAFRAQMIEADSIIKYRIFHSPSDEQVILGKNDWMFFDKTLNDYVGITLDNSEIEIITDKLSKICDYIESQGKQPLVMIVPNKNTIYPEYMPKRFGKKASVTNMTLLQEAMDRQEIPYLDVKSVLLEGKDISEVYLHYDTHWNNTGARLVLNELYGSLGISDRHSIGDYSIEASHEPDLYKMLFPSQDFMENQHIYAPLNHYDYIGRFRSIDDLNIKTSSQNGNGKSILVYRDSFGRAMIPYMAEIFDSCIFNRSTPYDLSLINQTDCDYVVIEIVERNIWDLGNMELPN